jgi:hypothetical protein
MLDLDCRTWMRELRRTAAVPFSQLPSTYDSDDIEHCHAAGAVCFGGNNVDEATLHIEQIMSLHAALHSLTRHQRQVVWGCCVLGCTENEMAAQLGISRSAVRNRLSGALSRLRSFFQEGKQEDKEAEVVLFATRTGRSSPAVRARKDSSATKRMIMARDEKRPDLVGVGAGRPILLQGIFDFEETGMKTPELLSPKLSYTVPTGRIAGIRFFRVGVMCDKMVCLSTVVNGDPHRLIPVAPHSTMHVPFAIVEPILAGSQIEIHVASEAPGTAIIDVGCLEMPA